MATATVVLEAPEKQADNRAKALKNPNLFQPGKSGNPKGRPPKDVSLTSLAKQYLEEVPDIQVGGAKNTKTWRQLLVQSWLVMAYKGNSALFQQLLERVDGRVVQRVEQTGAGGGPIEVKYIEENLLVKLEALATATRVNVASN